MSLDEWLKYATEPSKASNFSVINYHFPTDKHREEYLSTVTNRTEGEVRSLLRNFLVATGSLGVDKMYLKAMTDLSNAELSRRLETNEYTRRLFLDNPPWEGITWVLDLLPHYPGKALDALDAYFIAHCQLLPDGRIHGLSDAESIIRARYLHCENTRDALLALRPGEFEFLVGALYKDMGYQVVVTQTSQDGGVDVIATQLQTGSKVTTLIQCKRYDGPISVHAIRELNGVVSKRHANKGVVVTTSRFTRSAKREAEETPIIELIDFDNLNLLLNRHFGSHWPMHLSSHIRSIEYAQTKATTSSASAA